MTHTIASSPYSQAVSDDSLPSHRFVRADSTPLILNVAAREQRRADRTELLRRSGYAVVEAGSESEAIRTVIHRNVALAVLDDDLPECDLLAFADTLRRMRPAMAVVTIGSASDGLRGKPGDRMSIRDGDERQLLDAFHAALHRNEEPDETSDADVVTDDCGRIQGVSEHGARLLNGTARGLFQRNLIIFFDGRRDVWLDAIRRAGAGERVQMMGRLRPKERRPLGVSVRIGGRAGAAGAMLEWVIEPATPDA